MMSPSNITYKRGTKAREVRLVYKFSKEINSGMVVQFTLASNRMIGFLTFDRSIPVTERTM
jgi:hypothetical protein